MAIKLIRIRNFQSHENVTLDLVPGVNIAVGDSGSGKTALVRAIQWLAMNRPLGFRFHSIFSKSPDTTVEVGFDDGTNVSVCKTGKRTVYTISKDGKVLGEWLTPGTAVPDEVLQLLNLSNLNIQEQLDQPFLITNSPGEVGRTLNEVTRIEKVDGWISGFTSEINSRNRLVSAMEGEQKVVDDKLQELGFVDRADRDLRVLEGAFSDLQSLIVRHNRVSAMTIQLEGLNRDVDVLEGQIKSLTALDEKVTKLVELCETTDEQIEKLDEVLEYAPMLDHKIQGLTVEVEELEKGLKGMLRNLGKCPLCESPMTEAMIKRIVGSEKGA